MAPNAIPAPIPASAQSSPRGLDHWAGQQRGRLGRRRAVPSTPRSAQRGSGGERGLLPPRSAQPWLQGRGRDRLNRGSRDRRRDRLNRGSGRGRDRLAEATIAPAVGLTNRGSIAAPAVDVAMAVATTSASTIVRLNRTGVLRFIGAPPCTFRPLVCGLHGSNGSLPRRYGPTARGASGGLPRLEGAATDLGRRARAALPRRSRGLAWAR